MLSVLIPSRNEKFLNKTICDLLQKAKGDIEVICALDGYWESPIADPRVHYIHRGEPLGMRAGINAGAALAKGEYLLKADAHTMWDEGWDVKLAADCTDRMVMIPRRKRLDAENWCVKDVGKPDVDYEYLSAPVDPKDWGGAGLHGKQWNTRTVERIDKEDYMVDDAMSAQGSAWCMKRDYFYELELMDDANYGPFWSEAQEVFCKAWLSGGRCVVNKKTHYAHLHKGPERGRGYTLPETWLKQGRDHTMKWLRNEAWHKQTVNFSALIEKFWPVPTWTEEMLAEIKKYDKFHNKIR